MDILQSYIMNPRKPSRCPNATISIEENNPLCDDSLIVDLMIENGLLLDFCYQGNISLTAVGSLGFLHDVLLGMKIIDISELHYDFFASNDIVVTMKRQKTLALPLLTIINACKKYLGQENFLDIETFAYTQEIEKE